MLKNTSMHGTDKTNITKDDYSNWSEDHCFDSVCAFQKFLTEREIYKGTDVTFVMNVLKYLTVFTLSREKDVYLCLKLI